MADRIVRLGTNPKSAVRVQGELEALGVQQGLARGAHEHEIAGSSLVCPHGLPCTGSGDLRTDQQ